MTNTTYQLQKNTFTLYEVIKKQKLLSTKGKPIKTYHAGLKIMKLLNIKRQPNSKVYKIRQSEIDRWNNAVKIINNICQEKL